MKLLKWIPALLCAGTLLFSCTKEPGTDKEGLPDKDENGNPVGGTYDYFIYGVADIAIDTDGGLPVDSKESKDYRPCSIRVDGNGIFTDYDGRGKIRGRGNSTWEWYRKKPYRIKLDTSADFMSMPNNRDWVLLADYRDVTHMMNSTGFTLAHHLGIPYTNHSRFARLTLNGKYMGLYMVTEQVEEGGNRVAVDKEEGILLALDINDGPEDVPDATDNFWSEEFGMACAVKYPEDATKEITEYVKQEFADLEWTIRQMDWEEVSEILDVRSMIDYLIVEEVIANVEMDNNPSTRSAYISRKSPSDKWIMGPVWDCDAGFSYNWGDMYDSWGWGHTFFENHRILIMGSNPFTGAGAYGSGVGPLFRYLFGMPEFVAAFKERWNGIKDGLQEAALDNIKKTEEAIRDDAIDDMDLWGIDNYSHTAEVGKMKTWLRNRFKYLDGIINAYPEKAGK